jgi:hypothetical protein
MNRPGPGRHVGRGGRLLLRPAACFPTAANHAAEGAFARGAPALSALRHRDRSSGSAIACAAGDRANARTPEAACPSCCSPSTPRDPGHLGVADRGIIALLNPDRLRRILGEDARRERVPRTPTASARISKYHERHPYVLHVNGGQEYRVDYLPAESNTGMFGGNSNWRGPVWMPVNAMIIRALLHFYLYYGDSFQVECPTGSGMDDEPLRGGKGDRATGSPASSCAISTGTPARLRRRREVPGRSRTGATTSSSTNTSTATTAPGWAPATRPAGPGSWPRSSSSSATWTPKRALEGGKQAAFLKGGAETGQEHREAASRVSRPGPAISSRA